MSSPHLRQLLGGLLGVAAGDALGATVEFAPPTRIQATYGTHTEIIGGGVFHWRPGQGTDDTDLTWAVIAGYLNDPDEPITHIAQEFVTWYRSGPPDIGGTTRRALATLATTKDHQTSGVDDDHSCGNGSLMRALPTALVRTDPIQRRRELAEISAITHAHPRCVDSCIAYGEIAAALLDGASSSDAITAAKALPVDAAVRTALNTPGATPVVELCTGGYVIDSLRCAVWAIQQTTTLEDTLIALVNRGDDADTTGAIAGGLLGVLHGVNAIPQRWRNVLEYTPALTIAGNYFAEIRALTNAAA